MKSLKAFLKKNKTLYSCISYFREVYILLIGHIYDFLRFFQHGGWRKRANKKDERNYYVMFLYHKIEKSLCYNPRNPKSGWNDVMELTNIISIANKNHDYGYHDIAAKQVIEKFLSLPYNRTDPRVDQINKILSAIDCDSSDSHGSLTKSKNELQSGLLESPEQFFFSRYSLREFSSQIIDQEIILRGINIARKTPSVCNRQHWHVYHTSTPKIRDLALDLQNGNRGFGHQIPNLLIVTVDQKGFFTTNEKNQGWIDGGMYLMSLIYAFHALGISSCALNWAQPPKIDKQLRKRLNIDKNHSIICMLALGYPQDTNLVCSSARLPKESFLTELSSSKD